MKKAITISAVLCAAILAYATVTGEYNTWFGYFAGEDASGNRATVFGAGAGGGAQEIYRTDLIGAAAGVGGCRFRDTVAIGYRALRDSMDMSNTVAIGSHALEGVGGMGATDNATWINGHFVANPPKYVGDSTWQQTQGEFYITGDASLTNGLAPIWYDGTTLHLRGYSAGGGLPASHDGLDTWNVNTNIVFGGYARMSVRFNDYVDVYSELTMHDGSSLVINNPESVNIGETNLHGYVQGVLGTALSGKTFDLSTDEGLREAVSNIVISLGGSVQVPSN